ncbi:MAG: DUF3306 domain-containing protein [Pseudomonadota bacterium]
MAADEFFKRWSRQKAQPEPLTETAPLSEVEPEVKPLPTMEDVAALNAESDFSPFVGKGVDEAVQRSAMKKLFSDPHFNVMDGLDIYIGDYNTFEPIPPEMLAMLNHAKALLDPLSQFEKPLMQLIEKIDDAVKLEETPPEIAAELTPAAAEATPEEAPADEAPADAPASTANTQDNPA